MEQTNAPLSSEELYKINAYWRAANYLSVGQIYLCDNPLLKVPLQLEHVKRLLLGSLGYGSRAKLYLCSLEPSY